MEWAIVRHHSARGEALKKWIAYDSETGEALFGGVAKTIESLSHITHPIIFDAGRDFMGGMYVDQGLLLDQGVAPSNHHVWSWSKKQWVQDIDSARASKRKSTDAERERRGHLPIAYNGARFDADAKAQRNIQAWLTQLSNGATLPNGFVWRDYDNNDHPCDAAFLSGLGGAITVRGTQLYQACWAHKAEIERIAGTGDFDALLSYDVTAGWP